MKLWPQKKWKQMVLVAVLAFFIIVFSLLGFVFLKISSDYTSEVKVLNAGGSKTALVIFHPGLSSFMEDVTYSFANGLVTSGWRVEITTPSSEAPTDLTDYSLLVLGSPVYAGNATVTIGRHLERIGDLQGITTVLLVTSGGSDGEAEAVLQQTVEEHNGTVESVLSYYTSSSIQETLDLAEQAGREFVIAKR